MPISVYDPSEKPEWQKFRGKKAKTLAKLMGEHEMGTPELSQLYMAMGPAGMMQAILERKAANDRARQLSLEAMYAPWKNIYNPATEVMSRERQGALNRELTASEGEAGRKSAERIADTRNKMQMRTLTENLKERAASRRGVMQRHRQGIQAADARAAQKRAQEQTQFEAQGQRLREKEGHKRQQEKEKADAKRINDFLKARSRALNTMALPEGRTAAQELAVVYSSFFPGPWQEAVQAAGGDATKATQIMENVIQKRGLGSANKPGQ